jgi:hypothetical protein
MERVIVKSFFVWLLIIIFSLSNSHSVYAETLNKLPSSNSFPVQDLSLMRKVGEPITLVELGLENWQKTPANAPNKYQLFRLNIRLRDIGRYLGTGWPVIVPIPEHKIENSETENYESKGWKITDFRDTDGQWISMSSGHALRMAAQELEILNNSGEQPLVDFLVTDEASQNYRQLLGVSLAQYCSELVNLFKLSSNGY